MTSNRRVGSRPLYDNAFSEKNVYGHALALLTRSPKCVLGGLHLDIGCGFGRIAEPLISKTGLGYVGLDADEECLENLRQRGFEAHHVRLSGYDESYECFQRVIAGRPVASISFLDALEHLPHGDDVLRAIGRLAAEHSAPVVVSVPNVAHGDIGRKLAFGLWDYTDAGLLDHTHLRLFDNRLLIALLQQAGLHVVDAYDVEQVESDQHFPVDHPALTKESLLCTFLHDLRAKADPHEHTNQFVRLCVAGPIVDVPTFTSEREVKRPFLSVIMRTQGTRMHTLAEALTCLAGQTDDDFEVLIMGHQLSMDSLAAVERVIQDCPRWLRPRIQFVPVEKGDRARPLNTGFALARGHYIAALDDDDLPMAHWVETFRKLAQLRPGRVLRAVCVRQDVVNVGVAGKPAVRAQGPPECLYPSSFDLLEHLRSNSTPNCSVAFPRGVFQYLNIRFDEDLTTTEDWDFLLRTAAVVGVASCTEITSIYRWWLKDESSRTIHRPQVWQENHERILAKLNSIQFLLSPRSLAGGDAICLEDTNPAKTNTRELEKVAIAQADAYGRLQQPSVHQLLLRQLKSWLLSLRNHVNLRIITASYFFNPYWYLFVYPDVAKAGVDPALHYLLHGGREGRHPGPYFDCRFYLDHNADVAASGLNPLLHYIKYGQAEGREIRRVTKFW